MSCPHRRSQQDRLPPCCHTSYRCRNHAVRIQNVQCGATHSSRANETPHGCQCPVTEKPKQGEDQPHIINYHGPVYYLVKPARDTSHSTCPTCGQHLSKSVQQPEYHYHFHGWAVDARVDPRDALLYDRRPEDYFPSLPRYWTENYTGIRWIPALPEGSADCRFYNSRGGRGAVGALGRNGERRPCH